MSKECLCKTCNNKKCNSSNCKYQNCSEKNYECENDGFITICSDYVRKEDEIDSIEELLQ